MIKPNAKNSWTISEDIQLLEAVNEYNKNSKQDFPLHPFGRILKISNLKEKYLSGFSKSNKQIRTTWINRLSPLVKKMIDVQDQELLIRLCKQYPKQWTKISKMTFSLFKEESYYSENQIKNFFHSNMRTFRKEKKRKSNIDSKLQQLKPLPNLIESNQPQIDCLPNPLAKDHDTSNTDLDKFFSDVEFESEFDLFTQSLT